MVNYALRGFSPVRVDGDAFVGASQPEGAVFQPQSVHARAALSRRAHRQGIKGEGEGEAENRSEHTGVTCHKKQPLPLRT